MATIRPRGNGFQAIVRVKRNGVVVHSEAKTFPTELLAKDWAARLERRIKNEGVQTRKMSSVLFGALITQFRTARNENRPIGRAMDWDLDLLYHRKGHLPLSALNSAQWVAFARDRRNEGAGPATVLHNLSSASTVLAAAKPLMGVDIDAREVSEAIKMLSLSGHVAKSRERTRRPTASELEALQAAFARQRGHPTAILPMRQVLHLALAFPRRLGELCDMKWEHYTGTTMTLVDTKHPRVPRTEVVPVPVGAKEVLDSLPRYDARILPYNSRSVATAFQRACAEMRIVDLRFHDLRHEGICRLFEAGLNIPEVSLISGHKSWSSLKRYTHLAPEHVLKKLHDSSQVR